MHFLSRSRPTTELVQMRGGEGPQFNFLSTDITSLTPPPSRIGPITA